MTRFPLPVLLALAMPSAAVANPIGGLAGTLGTQNFSLSAAVGYMTRQMDPQGGHDDFAYETKRLTVQANYGLLHYVNVYLQAGLADAHFDDRDFASPLATWMGGGLRLALLPREQPLQLLLDGQIGYFKPDEPDVGEVKVLEYQVEGYARMSSENVHFFGGLQYSEAEMDFSGGGGEAEAEDNLGAFIGVDYFVNPNVFFTSELHIFDQQSLYLGVGYRL